MQLHMNLFHRPDGHHFAAWRHPSARPAELLDINYSAQGAITAERGLFDSVFLADSVTLGSNPWSYLLSPLEPISELSALAMVTKHIGLIATVSTTYSDPFTTARKLASLDHISKGRAGWNIVTTQATNAGANFSQDETMHADRYKRAAEFTDVVLKLWDSWEDDALVADKDIGLFVDPDKVHPINHKGEHFQVAGALNIPRPPQGHPLLVQAGSSPDGMDFGASVADAIFTAQFTLAQGKEFYSAMKSKAKSHGRDPDSIKILPGIAPILGSTEEEANQLAKDMEELTFPLHSVLQLSVFLGVDLTQYPLDGLVPLDDIAPPEKVQGHLSRYHVIVDMCREKKTTIRDLVRWHISGRSHRSFIGTPEQLADEMENWLLNKAADGFNLMPSLSSNGLDLFVDHVVPILQNKGIYRRSYEEQTLKAHFGLARTPNPRNTLAK
jgi:FMN-dependent oxidoreductase (nitrilotriacetate monooxygenase family)